MFHQRLFVCARFYYIDYIQILKIKIKPWLHYNYYHYIHFLFIVFFSYINN